MGAPKSHRHDRRQFGFYKVGRHFVLDSLDLTSKMAYRVLSHVERLILRDCIRAYNRQSKFDRELPKGGFTYTWEQCTEDVSERAFREAMKRLVRIGWIEWPPEVQDNRPASARRYMPSQKWNEYKPSASEREKLTKYDQMKAGRCIEKRRRRQNYLSGKAKS